MFIIINLILPILLGILSSWIYDSIKDMRYQNAILLIMRLCQNVGTTSFIF
nr:MAG TPA: hypothetical protein [Caudoviricetes sp.]